MAKNTPGSDASSIFNAPLEDLSKREARYQALAPAARAKIILADADPALQAAQRLLKSLATPALQQAFARMRKNAMLIGKMRPSEAKTLLMDGEDFLEGAGRKLAAWEKTLQRLADGEANTADSPLALAIGSSSGSSNYLSVISLAITDMTKNDSKNAAPYQSAASEIRRCATLLADCEHASGFHKPAH